MMLYPLKNGLTIFIFLQVRQTIVIHSLNTNIIHKTFIFK